jgi:hypothetical protein
VEAVRPPGVDRDQDDVWSVALGATFGWSEPRDDLLSRGVEAGLPNLALVGPERSARLGDRAGSQQSQRGEEEERKDERSPQGSETEGGDVYHRISEAPQVNPAPKVARTM